MSLTEWGGTGTDNATNEAGLATILNQTARLVFGMPGTTGMTLWNLRNGSGVFAPVGTLYDNNWAIRDTGVAWQALMSQWDTDLELTVLPDGTIDFTGFYGEYEVTIGEQTFLLDLTKGTTDYSLVVGAPSADFDLDGDVDGRDFLTWQRGFDLENPTFANGDANYDGEINDLDLAVWIDGFNAGSPLGASVTVPEPSAFAISALATLLFACRRRDVKIS